MLAAACVTALAVNANTSAVTILLPAISEDTGAPVAQLQWAVTGYLLVGAAVIVTSGSLGDAGAAGPLVGGVLVGLSRAAIFLTFFCAAGILLLAMMRRYKARRPRPADLAAAAAAPTHTIPVPQEV